VLGVGVAAPLVVVVAALRYGFAAGSLHVCRFSLAHRDRIHRTTATVSRGRRSRGVVIASGAYRMCTCCLDILPTPISGLYSCSVRKACRVGNDTGHCRGIPTCQDSRPSPLLSCMAFPVLRCRWGSLYISSDISQKYTQKLDRESLQHFWSCAKLSWIAKPAPRSASNRLVVVRAIV
jgi:hypothetical protein